MTQAVMLRKKPRKFNRRREERELGKGRRRTWLQRQLSVGYRSEPSPKPKKPPEAGLAVPAVPPKGPAPKSGGAEAPLEFD